MVVSNCMPGIAAGMRRLRDHPHQVARRDTSSQTSPVLTKRVCQFAVVLATARMNSSVTRTELLAFWKNTEP